MLKHNITVNTAWSRINNKMRRYPMRYLPRNHSAIELITILVEWSYTCPIGSIAITKLKHIVLSRKFCTTQTGFHVAKRFIDLKYQQYATCNFIILATKYSYAKFLVTSMRN